jgi:alanine racemase
MRSSTPPLDIYLKVNSGMNRLGFQPERVHTVWQQLRALKNVGEMTLMAHFADAEKPDGIADAMVRIEQAAEGLDCPLAVELGGHAVASRGAQLGASGDRSVRCVALWSVAGYRQQRPEAGNDPAQ